MKIINQVFALNELKEMAIATFGDMVKAVVDTEKELIAIDAELHSDLEALLLESGSKQENLWGINLYPEAKDDGFVEFDSMINLRPSQNNKTRGVEDKEIRKRIIEIADKRFK